MKRIVRFHFIIRAIVNQFLFHRNETRRRDLFSRKWLQIQLLIRNLKYNVRVAHCFRVAGLARTAGELPEQ